MKPDSRKCSWSFLTERNETAPGILFTLKALKWIRAMVEEHSGEVGFMGVVEEIGGKYVISEIFYPKHCLATSATCEIAPEGMTGIAQKLIEQDRVDDIGKVRFWGHSHHTMGTSPSGQDDSQALEMMNSSGAYLIRAICTKNGEMSVSFFDHGRQLKFENVKWKVLVDYDSIMIGVINAINVESNNEEKVKLIRAAVSDNLDFKDDEEYKAIAKEVKELKKEMLPPETRGSVHGVHNGRNNVHTYGFGHQRGNFQQDMFEDDEWMEAYANHPYGGYRDPRRSGKPIDKKKSNPLLTDQELNEVVNAAWEGETL